MASVTPVAAGTAGFTAPGFIPAQAPGIASTVSMITNLAAGTLDLVPGTKWALFYFASVGDTDTWDAAPKKSICAFWCGEDVDTDIATAYVTDVGGIGDAAQIQFQTGGAGQSGWLLVFYQ